VHFLDTNIVLRLFIAKDPDHELIRRTIEVLESRGEALAICLQVLVEIWVVATRPVQNNGLGWPTETVLEVVGAARSRFLCLLDDETTGVRWSTIVAQCAIRGKRAHDVRIAALMECHGITRIVTLNEQDFAGLPGITVVHPRMVAGPV
jgi:predicted nucleic acid-binding protein